MDVIGEDFQDIFTEKKTELFTQFKFKLGNDVSTWGPGDIVIVQKILKDYKAKKDREEKLQNAQKNVEIMQEKELRDKVKQFLNKHPEYCDNFS